ncbi:SusC/RagA family TonB-linked outer membrane protein [Sphingobacterium sp. HJSM2_6]|uniref:SusC/RagA family TonB-linked outer membrane protein n=1 Tax=Sphingobacterium sp. HJSM2_6 TaxID=3366264 RepID=UPI003BD7BC06
MRITNNKSLPLLLALLWTLLVFPAHAQDLKTINGTVSSTEGPLSNATVTSISTGKSTKTDAAGQFRLNAALNTQLRINLLGYKEVLITINSENLSISLEKSTEQIDEVVVVSYGTQQKSKITGAISELDASKAKDLPVGQFTQKIQGRIAGAQVTQINGRPGQGMAVRIRGSASMNAGNNPLYVVDGQAITGNINNINPDEIETFSVLKDASATALYGSRAANGVVLITTKKGKGEGVSIDFSSYYGAQYLPQRGRPDVMNAREFATWQKAFYEDKIKYENWKLPATGIAEIPEDYRNPEQYGEGTNWYDVLFQNAAPIQNYSLSVLGAGEKFNVGVTAGYFNQQGILLNTGYQRYSFRANTEYRPNKRLTLGFNVAPSLQMDHNTLLNLDGQRQVIDGAFITSPISPAINPDGSLPLTTNTYGMFANPNWLRVLKEKQDNYKRFRILGNISAKYNIWDNLNFATRADYDLGNDVLQNFTPSTAGGGLFVAPPQLATGAYNTANYYSWLNENVFTYNKSIGDHNFDVLAGYTTQRYMTQGGWLSKTDFPNDDIPWLSAGATVTGAGSNTASWTLESLITRLNYDYQGKYLLSAAMRRDGSSRFGAEKKWGSFPSVSVGWLVSNEDFLKENATISQLKLRASYGIVGNNNIGNYTSIAMMGGTNYTFNNILNQGLSITSLGNTLLSWEKTDQWDIGFDLAILQNRVQFHYDYYHKVTDGMLYPVELPRASGFSAISTNIGTFKFWGHELSINANVLQRNEFSWDADFNISFNRNEVVKLGTNNTPIGGYSNQGDFNRTEVGQPIGQFYGYIFDGVYMNQQEFDAQPKHQSSKVGTARMKDLNADGVIDINDRTFIGNPNPDFIFGFNNTFRYKNWDLGLLFTGSVGAQTMAATFENLENIDGVFNMRKEMLNMWRSEDNPGNGQVPRTLTGTTELYRFNNSRWVYDADYLSLKNITLGKRFQIQTDYIKSIRLYASVQEAFMWTKYPYANPEVSTSGSNPLALGIDQTAYPIPRTFTFGFNIGF